MKSINYFMERLMDCRCGEVKKVVKIAVEAPVKIKRRLLELGFTGGQRVRLERKSMFGDTYLIEVRGYCLTLRKMLTEFIIVE